MTMAIDAPAQRRCGTLVEVAALATLAAALLLPATMVVPEAITWPGVLDTIYVQAIDRWVIVALAIALGALGFSLRRGAPAFGVLAFVFIAGGASQLYVTEPLWFATLRLQPEGLKQWLMVLALVAELVAAGVILAQAGPARLLAEARARLGLGRIALFLVISAAFSVPAMGYVDRGAPGAFAAHVLAAGFLILLHLTVLGAMGLVRSPISGLYRLSAVAPAVFTVVAALALSWFGFERVPHVTEEVAFVLQAQTFAGGGLSVPAPPEAALPGLYYELFQIRDGRWFAPTAPGWPVALALGFLVGLPWLVNPLLAGIAVLLAHDIARRQAGRDAADMLALMMAASPWLLAAAASLMPHTLTLTLMLLAWWLVLRAEPGTRTAMRRLVLAGVALGWVFLTRPPDGLAITLLTALWLFFGPRGHLRRLLPFAGGALAVMVLGLGYNGWLTGNPFLSPYAQFLSEVWHTSGATFGLGGDVGPAGGSDGLDLAPGHSAFEGLINTHNALSSLQFEMLGWSVGSLALVIAYLIWQRPKGFDGAMIAVVAVLGVMTFFYWFADIYYIGPRYWFLASFPLLYLAMRGYEALRTRFAGRGEMDFLRIDSVLWLLCLFGLLVFTPWRGVAKYNDFADHHAAVRDDMLTGRFGNAVVLVTGRGHPDSALSLNDPWLRADRPVFLNDTGTLDREALAAAFPGRQIIDYRAPWTP